MPKTRYLLGKRPRRPYYKSNNTLICIFQFSINRLSGEVDSKDESRKPHYPRIPQGKMSSKVLWGKMSCVAKHLDIRKTILSLKLQQRKMQSKIYPQGETKGKLLSTYCLCVALLGILTVSFHLVELHHGPT